MSPFLRYDENVKKTFKIIILSFFLLFFFVILKPSPVYAKITADINPSPIYTNTTGIITFTFTSDQNNTFVPGQGYYFGYWKPGTIVPKDSMRGDTPEHPVDDKTFKSRFNTLGNTLEVGTWSYRVWQGRYITDQSTIASGNFYVYPPSGPGGSGLPGIGMDNDQFQANTLANLYILNVQENQKYSVWFDGESGFLFSDSFNKNQIQAKEWKGTSTSIATTQINVGGPGDKKICMTQATPALGLNWNVGFNCDFSLPGPIRVSALPPPTPSASITPPSSGQIGVPTGAPPTPTFPLPTPPCDITTQTGHNGEIIQNCTAVQTALGKIETDPALFVKKIFSILLSISGGIALILIIVSGYHFVASQGNPEKIQGARETLTSAIVGLLFIIFSMVILEVIGVDILHIPGLTK